MQKKSPADIIREIAAMPRGVERARRAGLLADRLRITILITNRDLKVMFAKYGVDGYTYEELMYEADSISD